jgi:ribonuclease VapC
MFLDASVIVACMLGEPERDAILASIQHQPRRATGPIAVFEASSALVRVWKIDFEAAFQRVERWLDGNDVSLILLDEAIMRETHACAARYHATTGHPARLNMGDCFAYAAARTRGLKLAYKGDDFGHTDADAVRFGG